METKTITQNVTLIVENCITCGVAHALPQTMRDEFYKNGGFWHCPNGHTQGWDKANCQTTTDKLRAQLKTEKENVEYWQKRKNEVEKQLTAQKGQMTKLKNRVKNGVCPCCNRSFVNVQRHIKTKHPDFTEKQ